MKRLLLTSLGVGFSVVYLFLALLTSGGGHGPSFTFAGAAPYGLGLLLFPVFGFLLSDLKLPMTKVACLVMLVAHYVAVAYSVATSWVSEMPYAERAWSVSPSNILLPVGWYVAGQFIVWGLLARSVIAGKRQRHPTIA
ncbi:MAG: hypothetical protein H0W76_12990 [Pyrinomonadaceae bacterium]|nr:hypothetical protein [Pyrinomonadaceae bacterium]